MKSETMEFINSIKYDKEELEEVIEELRKVNDKLDDEIAKNLLVQHLESMVHKRMSIFQMEQYVNSLYDHSYIHIRYSQYWDNVSVADYNLIGSTYEIHQHDECVPVCDFDIYVLPTKETSENGDTMYYITEVGYEF